MTNNEVIINENLRVRVEAISELLIKKEVYAQWRRLKWSTTVTPNKWVTDTDFPNAESVLVAYGTTPFNAYRNAVVADKEQMIDDAIQQYFVDLEAAQLAASEEM